MKTNYLKPSHPTFFASPAIVYDYYDKKIPLKKIKHSRLTQTHRVVSLKNVDLKVHSKIIKLFERLKPLPKSTSFEKVSLYGENSVSRRFI